MAPFATFALNLIGPHTRGLQRAIYQRSLPTYSTWEKAKEVAYEGFYPVLVNMRFQQVWINAKLPHPQCDLLNAVYLQGHPGQGCFMYRGDQNIKIEMLLEV